MSGFYEKLTEHVAGFAVIYGVFLSFGEAGPGDCLGLLASKTWPTAARGQMCTSRRDPREGEESFADLCLSTRRRYRRRDRQDRCLRWCVPLLRPVSGPFRCRGGLFSRRIFALTMKLFSTGVWAFPAIIADFPAGPKQTSGPFWVGSGLAFLSALIAFFLIPEAKMDGMTLEDERFREYLAAEGYDVSQMGTHSQLSSSESAFEEGAAADDDKKVVESSY